MSFGFPSRDENKCHPLSRMIVVLAATLATLLIVVSLASQPHQNQAFANTPKEDKVAVQPVPGQSLMNQMDPFTFLDPVPEGQMSPDFTTPDANGQLLSLSSFRGKKNVVLIFYQGDFCQVCGKQLENFQSRYADFKAQDAEILAISGDDATRAAKTMGEHGLSFRTIPDQNLKIIRKFGVLNVSKHNVAWPSLFVVDKKGIVRLSFADKKFARLYSEDVLKTLAKINGRPLQTPSR